MRPVIFSRAHFSVFFYDLKGEVMNMEDTQIIGLYFARSEEALSRSSEKYGGLCMSIAQRILNSRPDSEECVNDTWLGAWNSIPPARPLSLSAFFGKITRNLAVDRVRRKTAQKRGSGEYAAALSELDECVPSGVNVEKQFEAAQLAELIGRWLSALPQEKRAAFILRYFYMKPVAEVAADLDISLSKTAAMLRRERISLKAELEREGYTI